MQPNSPLITLSPNSPSFNSYSSGKLAEIAARVVQEFTINDQSQEQDTTTIFSWQPNNHSQQNITIHDEVEQEESEQNDDDDEEEEFEFAVVCREPVASPISADDIFYNGQIKTVYPLFNTALLDDKDKELPSDNVKPSKKPHRLPLRKLFSEERESSCSSSEADELENVPADTYCVWKPKKTGKEGNSDMCKKSSSTGSSKRWKFRDLLHRSNSDGKDTFVFLTPAADKKGSGRRVNCVEENGGKDGKFTAGNNHVVKEYAKNGRVVKEGDKRRSFLPYKQDLVGFFSNVNGLSRNLHPF